MAAAPTKRRPRLSAFLRAYGNVSFKYEERTEVQAGLPQPRGRWERAATRLAGREAQVKRLRKLVLEVVGTEVTPEQADTACLSFLQLFLRQTKLSATMLRELKLEYGAISQAQADQLLAAVAEAVAGLPEETLEALAMGEEEQELTPMFGINIKFTPPSQLPREEPDLSYLSAVVEEQDFSLASALSFKLEANKPPPAAAAAPAVAAVDTAWLEETLRTCYPDQQPLGLAVAEFAATILDMLGSKRSSEELQAELFDLCGFERFDMIGAVLENREALVRSLKQNKVEMRAELNRVAASLAAEKAGEAKPNFGCQVIVQSEEEKALLKQARKEEKRINKLLNRADEEEDEEEFDFNPVDLRTKRQAALAMAMSQPLFKEREEAREVAGPAVSYPYVFDSLAKAKLTTGFVQGTKMSLPAGFTRKDEKKYEEVAVPAMVKAGWDSAKETGVQPRPVAQLEEIGRLAFKGIKCLNQIQSVVCDTAYNTNENMLVCAPTGAGKTNVAMLCITQTIKQHFEAGVIKKDQFKIVYVAPMKALASEMAAGFGRRLEPLGLLVRELTGDMSLTKAEISQTQMLVTTPEKWDVVTRKQGDTLASLVKLLIIDEVHLLHGDRGPVLEALVARTLRQVEHSQTVIRVVGLSATLPNYIDVATFLRVNPYKGLFFFDGRFRPVPLGTTFIGVKQLNAWKQKADMDEICYERVADFVRAGHQVMVFVHTRNGTSQSAMVMKEKASQANELGIFEPTDNSQLGLARNAMKSSRNRQLQELFPAGFGIHHAGMLRSDRNLVEKFFSQGVIKVLCCTATLAWGVNLPAHAVIIKGTEIYNAKIGGFMDVGILDVLQIFGRAGRPQFDKSGHGTIITSHDKLAHYLSLLTNQFPIESNFIGQMTDNLNAEVSLGTVTSVAEAVEWLGYSYLYVRMRKNPQCYGIKYQELRDDPSLLRKRKEIIVDAARRLDKAKMIRFDEANEYLSPCDLGRTASHFYVKYDTVEIFNEKLVNTLMNESDILHMVSLAQEFEQLKVREDEMTELDDATHDFCEMPVKGGAENVHGKVNILLQTHISRGRMRSFSLISDMTYITTNAARIARALFEIVLRRNLPLLAGRMLKFAKCVELQMWDFSNPLKQHPGVKPELVAKLENYNFTLHKLRELDAKEIGLLVRHVSVGSVLKRAAEEVPMVELAATIQPITRSVLRVRLTVTPDFRWNDRFHGKSSEPFWIWVEDPASDHMYHHEYFVLTKKQVMAREAQELCFTIPIFEPLPSQYYVRATSDRWLGSETMEAISFKHLILPERHPPHTDLLDLTPLPISALQEPSFEALYPFTHFNPVQTQIFHTLYHTDKNVLLGAPTGSGKTIAAELAIFRVFREQPKAKVVYIAPMKALVRERIGDWRRRLEVKLGKRVVELTGDSAPDGRAIAASSVIVTTPEKWDGVSRSWQTRNFVQDVALIVIDEIHLLGEDRGPVLEVIVSRTNFISSHTERGLRIVGLSTALSNAKDLADWLGIGQQGLFNFRPSVRPVPLECHISGYPGKHYCPRMASMTKPAFQGIKQHSPTKPVLVFVASRRQTWVTAQDLMAHLGAEVGREKQWLHMEEHEMERVVANIKDTNLRHCLSFGIGIHHAGLVERDRKTVEELYVNMKIQVLVATATLAWGVNFPTHLVVVKGTEFYDGKLKRYVDMPITDVLQMIGRAGRPQYDDQGVAMVLVHDVKKGFYKKFLYEPFPVESSLLTVLADHMNAEVVAGTISSRQDALDYITWTFFFRRLVQNPTYYGMEEQGEEGLNAFLSGVVGRALDQLEESYCVETAEDGRTLYPTVLGRIASYYYLAHTTVHHFQDTLHEDMTTAEVLQALVDATEFAELPVRHNEDNDNTELAKSCPLKVNAYTMDSAHTKANLLLQCHFSRLPHLGVGGRHIHDYLTDTKSVMDQALRVLQAMVDVVAESGWLAAALRTVTMVQMVVQGRWDTDSPLLTLPHLEPPAVALLHRAGVTGLPELQQLAARGHERLATLLRPELDERKVEEVLEVVQRLPVIQVSLTLEGSRVKLGGCERVVVRGGETLTLAVTLTRTNKPGREGTKVHAPRFPKPKDEGWVLLVGDPATRELVALKRVGPVRASTSVKVSLVVEEAGEVDYCLYLLSDSYLGLDQQYDLLLEVQQAQEA